MIRRALSDVSTIKRLLTQAEREAQLTGDDLPGPEHLVLAALSLPDGTAAAALAAVGTDEESFRAALLRCREEALLSVGIEPSTDAPAEPAPGTGVYRSTYQAQATFQAAARLAKQAGSPGLRGAHVVAAAADDCERGTLRLVLRSLGVSPADLHAAALRAAR